jgi:hypothetical protein
MGRATAPFERCKMLRDEIKMVRDMIDAAKAELKEYIDAQLKALKAEAKKTVPKAEPKK